VINPSSEIFPRLILWDIDGTLIRTKRLNSASPHKNALRNHGYSFHESRIEFSGLTDYEVFLEIIKMNGRKIDRKSLLSAFNDLDEESLKLDKVSTFDLYQGVQEMLEGLAFLGWTHGILTGNTKFRLNSKLKNAGIASYFKHDLLFGCEFGDSRESIANNAREFLRHKKYSLILVLGDTPKDITAARSVNFPVISVATGSFSVDQLSIYKPDILLRDLTIDAEILFKFLNHLVYS